MNTFVFFFLGFLSSPLLRIENLKTENDDKPSTIFKVYFIRARVTAFLQEGGVGAAVV